MGRCAMEDQLIDGVAVEIGPDRKSERLQYDWEWLLIRSRGDKSKMRRTK